MNKRNVYEASRKVNRSWKAVSTLGFRGTYDHLRFILKSRSKLPVQTIKETNNVDVVLTFLPVAIPCQPPLGIASLKSYLKEKGISCVCKDFNVRLYSHLKGQNEFEFSDLYDTFVDEKKFNEFGDSVLFSLMDDWVDEILDIDPRFLGISLSSTVVYFPLNYMIDRIRSKSPKTKIILGGPRCSYDGENLIEKGFGDVVIIGDGEETFFDVVDAISRNKDLKDVKGIIFKEGNKIFHTGNPKIIYNLESLPFPDFSDLPMDDYLKEGAFGKFPKIPMLGSRSCPARCNFCNVPGLFGKYRVKSAKRIFDEISFYRKKYGSYDFLFVDSLVNVNNKLLEDLCDFIIESKEAFSLGGMFRIWEGEGQQRLFNKMAKAGWRGVSIGVESGSEKVRKDMNKIFKNSSLISQLKGFHRSGISPHLMFMVGYPTETENDFKETLSLILDNRNYIGSVSFAVTSLTEGTSFFKNKENMGIDYDEQGAWCLGKNTMEERLRRLNEAVGTCKKYLPVSYSSVCGLSQPLSVLSQGKKKVSNLFELEELKVREAIIGA